MTGTMLCALALAVAADSTGVANRSLRLIVETSSDLSHYSVQAEFRFILGPPASEVLFVFPDVEAPGALREIVLDGHPLEPALVAGGSHSWLGGQVLVLRPRELGMEPGEHVLRVLGPDVPAPERGLTRWGSWHPFLLGDDQAVPIDLEVHTPSRYAVVSSGHRVSEHVAEGMKISRWTTTRPQSWVFLAVGRYRTVVAGEGQPPFDIVLPEGVTHVAPFLLGPQPRAILDVYGRTFGVDSAAQFRLVVFPDQSIQRFSVDGLVGLSTAGYPQTGGGESLRAVLAHEFAHYWWGDLARPTGPGRRWLTEGFAEYSHDLYFTEAGEESLSWAFRNLAVLTRFGAVPAPPVGGEPDDTAPEVYYQKGPFVLRMLGDEIGHAALLGAMRRLVDRGRRAPITVNDFRALAEDEAGRDLGWFFEQWLARGTGPVLALEDVTVQRSAGGYRITGTILQHEPVYRLRVPLQVYLSGGGQVMRIVESDRARTAFAVETDQPPERLRVDPEHRLFKWYPMDRIPVSFADAWRAKGERTIRVEVGSEVATPDRTRLLEFLRARFGPVELGTVTSDGILVGEPAARLRRQRAGHLDPPPPGTVQAWITRSSVDPSHIVVGIEGDLPTVLPELIPQAGLTFVRYQGGAIVSAIAPALPPITVDLPAPRDARPGTGGVR